MSKLRYRRIVLKKKKKITQTEQGIDKFYSFFCVTDMFFRIRRHLLSMVTNDNKSSRIFTTFK